jgi:hypothetical protein
MDRNVDTRSWNTPSVRDTNEFWSLYCRVCHEASQNTATNPVCVTQQLEPLCGIFCSRILGNRYLTIPSTEVISRKKTEDLGRTNQSQSQSQTQSHITTGNQSDSPSWCQAPIWDPRPIFLSPWDFLLDNYSLLFVVPSLTRVRVCNLLLLLVLASAVTLGCALSDERSGQSFVSISLYIVSHYIYI